MHKDVSEPNKARVFVLAEEGGVLCCIPAQHYESAALEVRAAELLDPGGVYSISEADSLADGDQAVAAEVRSFVEGFLESQFRIHDGSWDLDEMWDQLYQQGEVDNEDRPVDWSPTESEIERLQVTVPESFYESEGLRSPEWRRYLPESVLRLGEMNSGMFGDYFFFDLSDRDKVIIALRLAGCEVIE